LDESLLNWRVLANWSKLVIMTHNRLVIIALTAASFPVALTIACRPAPLTIRSSLAVAVQYQNINLQVVADSLPGFTFQQKEQTTQPQWFQRLRKDFTDDKLSDLYLAEWGQELFSLVESGDLIDGRPYWKRSTLFNRAPAWLAHSTSGPAQGFLPSAVYTWGIFVNHELARWYMATEPTTMEALEAVFEAAKRDGITPIALGSAYGWPGAAWFTILDLRLNGAAAVSERYSGKRPFDDAGGAQVFRKLADWRDKGWFSEDASTKPMKDSLRAVETGKALCVLIGAFAMEQFSYPDNVRFAAIPYADGSPYRAEIAGMSGYVLPASIDPAKAETAFAFLDAIWKAGSPDQAMDEYKVPFLAVMNASATQGTVVKLAINEFKRVQAVILAGADDIVLSFDRAMPAQALQDSIPLWATFFGPTGGDGNTFANKFQSTIGRSIK